MNKKIENSIKFIKENVDKYGDDICLISSFGKDSNVVTHLVIQEKPDIPVLWVRPPFLPKETLKLSKHLVAEWGLNLVEVESNLLHDHDFMQNIVYEPNLPKTNPESCCQLFKDEPMFKKVKELGTKAWFSGLRNTESEKRGMFTREWKQGDFTKYHPILEWTEIDVWNYTKNYEIPYHSWYLKGYRSLGCEVCSFPTEPPSKDLDELIEKLKVTKNSERKGRYMDTAHIGLGCGLHCLPPNSPKSEWHKYMGKA